MRILSLLLLSLLLLPTSAAGQTFQDASDRFRSTPDPNKFIGGASAVDFDNDGLVDLYHHGRLYRQQSDGTFQDVLSAANILFEGNNVYAGIFGDADNNGFLDLMLIDDEPGSRFYLNRTGRSFNVANGPSGIRGNRSAFSSAWGDFNSDNRLDLFLGNDTGDHQLFIQTITPGVFGNQAPLLQAVTGSNFHSISPADYDGDGDLDVYITRGSVGAGGSRNVLLRYDNVRDRFFDFANNVGLEDTRASMGATWLDYNNDGALDLYVANAAISRRTIRNPLLSNLSADFPFGPRGGLNGLYRHPGSFTGFDRFEDVAPEAGVTGDSAEVHLNPVAADFDNDGFIDLFVLGETDNHYLFRNLGDGTFSDVYDTALADRPLATAVVVADFNNDGWIDLVLAHNDGNRLWLNEGGANHWLKVEARGTTSNRFGVGARVEVFIGDQQQTRIITAGEGLLSQSHNMTAHFGLGDATTVDVLRIRWPNGATETYTDIPADQTVRLVEGVGPNAPPAGFGLTAPLNATTFPTSTPTIEFAWEPATDADGDPVTYTFQINTLGTGYTFSNLTEPRLTLDASLLSPDQVYTWSVFAEDGFSTRTSLDVYQMVFGEPSNVTPTITVPLLFEYPLTDAEQGTVAFNDYDRDGDLDLFVNGLDTEGTPRSRFYRLDDVNLNPDVDPAFFFKTYTPTQDLFLGVRFGRVAWGDANNDQQDDLLLQGLHPENDTPETLLYRNEGGRFVEEPTELPGLHNGAMSWGDVDGDGDDDLVISGATQAERPFTPLTQFYRNDGGTLQLEATPFAPIVFGAVAWADYDGDGDLDLALSGDRGDGFFVAHLYRNDGNSFTDLGLPLTPLAMGSADWADYDGDGDLDLLMTGARPGPNLLQGTTRLYRNDGGDVFTSVDTGLPGVVAGTSRWTDYDGDGAPDVILSGARTPLGERIAHVYRNTDGRFVFALSLPGLLFSDNDAGDYNGDGDPDLVFIGQGLSGEATLNFFINTRIFEPVPGE